MIPKNLSVTLVEPRYPVNVGYVARLLKNFGLTKLYFVRPEVDMSVAAVYAAHASEILDNAQTVTFQQLRKRNRLLIATTAVRAKKGSNVTRRSLSPERISRYALSARSASLVFGRETTGLTNEEIKLCDLTAVIDTGSRHRTLNISHAAAIMLYVVSKSSSLPKGAASRTARELFAQEFHGLAAASRGPSHRVKNMLELGRRLAATSQLSDEQLLMMTGVFRKAIRTIEAGQGRPSKT